MSKVWLVTGSASGLGRNIAEAVLASGDRLVATARDPGRLKDQVEKYGDQVRTASRKTIPMCAHREDSSRRQFRQFVTGRLGIVMPRDRSLTSRR